MGVIAQYYPVGIGQAYCLYRRRHAAVLQTACRGEPRTPIYGGVIRRKRGQSQDRQ